MGRQVVRKQEAMAAARGAGPADAVGDTYLDRLLKLIPAEVVALYLFLEGVLQSALNEPDELGQLQGWLWGVFIVLIIGNVLFLRRYQQVKDVAQTVLLSLALVIWVLTLGGPFEYLDFYRPFMGSVLLGLFTFFVPLFYTGVPSSP